MARMRRGTRLSAAHAAAAVVMAAALTAGCGAGGTGAGDHADGRSDSAGDSVEAAPNPHVEDPEEAVPDPGRNQAPVQRPSYAEGGDQAPSEPADEDAATSAAREAELAADREVALETGAIKEAREGTIKPAPATLTETTGSTNTHTTPVAQQSARSDLQVYGTTSEKVRELQARLQQANVFHLNPTGFFGPVTLNAVRSFQGSHSVPTTGNAGPLTWKALHKATKQPTRSQMYPVTTRPVDKPDSRCLTGRVMCISKKSSTLTWMVNGKVRSAMDVRFGSQHEPTREGQFAVSFKSRHHVSTLYDSPMPYAMFFSGGQAVHYSSDFAARGYNGASHGCVNVRDKAKVAHLFDQVRPGDKVVVYH